MTNDTPSPPYTWQVQTFAGTGTYQYTRNNQALHGFRAPLTMWYHVPQYFIIWVIVPT